MRKGRAPAIVAAYLAGRDVARSDLERALSVAREDADYMSFLREELGMHADWSSECDIFLSRSAEFSELSTAEQRRQMPEMAAHLDVCGECRRAYERVRPLWASEAPTGLGRAVAAAAKRLTAAISVAASATGVLRVLAEPPQARPAAMLSPVGAVMMGPKGSDDVRPAGWRQWRFADEETGSTILVSVRAKDGSDGEIECKISVEADDVPAPLTDRVEVRRGDAASPYVAGLAAQFESSPIVLPEGSWVLWLVRTDQQRPGAWGIPLDVTKEEGRAV
jgi:hypothetical protein